MRTVTLAGQTLEVDADGFLLNPDQWTPDIAADLAGQLGITLTEQHWQVLDFCRRANAESGTAPTGPRLIEGLGLPEEALNALFPGSPARVAARLAGLGQPRNDATPSQRKDEEDRA